MKHILILFASLCILCGQAIAAARPNIVFILADEIRSKSGDTQLIKSGDTQLIS